MKVNWNENVCIHSGNCVNTLPEVFKVENDTLSIYADQASEAAVRKACADCPSGALTIEED